MAYRRCTRWLFSIAIVGLSFALSGMANADIAGPGWILGKAKLIDLHRYQAFYSAQRAALKTASVSACALPATTAPENAPEITKLARALQNDPKLIYEFVHNHIDHTPYFGYLKGRCSRCWSAGQ